MRSFIREHVAKIAGVLSGWDRIRFRGTFRQLTHRYLVSARGRLMLPILVALPQTTLDKLQPAA